MTDSLRNRSSILLLIVFLMFSCSKSKEKQAEEFIESARTFMSQNKPETALIEYRNAIDKDPGNYVALFELAEVYIVLKKIEPAIKYYNLAATSNSGSIPPHLRLAQIYVQMEKLLDARNEVSKILAITPNSIEAYHLLSGIQIKERDLDSAIETLKMAERIDAQNPKTLSSLAQLYVKTGKNEEAEKMYLSALAIDSSSRDIYMELVRFYGIQNQWEKIESLLTDLVKKPGITAQKYTDLALFYFGRGKFDLAEENYQKALSEAPEDISPFINLAEFYAKRGLKEKSIAVMEKALGKKKNSKLVLTGLSQIYLQFKMMAEAEKFVEDALKIDSNFVDALFQKGRVLMAKADYKQALGLFDKVISLDRVHARAYYYRALCIKEGGATDRPEQKIYRAAIGMLDKPEEFENDQVKSNLLAAVTLEPDLVDARLELAELYIFEKDGIKAKEQLDEIVKIKPPNLKMMNLLSGIKLLEGNKKDAEMILKAIIEQEPEYIPAYVRLGLLYKSMKNGPKALQFFQMAFDRNPDQIGLAKLMVNIYLEQKKYNESLDLIDKLEKKSKSEDYAFYENLRGEVYALKGDPDAALKSYNKSISMKPDSVSPYMNIANLYFVRKQRDLALQHYQSVEKISPDYLPALLSIGSIFDIQGDLDTAELYYRKVLHLNPKQADAANNLAFILSEKKDQLEEASRLVKIAMDQQPKNPNVLDTSGWIYYQRGNYLSAISELEASLKINPENPLTCFHYGMTLYMMKEYEKARKYLQKALKLDPGFRGSATAKRMLN